MSLEHDLSKGVMDKAKFLRYVAIPRNQSQYNQKALKSYEQDQRVDLSYGQALRYWSNRVSSASSQRDDEIVGEYLAYFMREAKSAEEFEQFFEVESFLNPLLAEVMLTSGDKDVAKWSGLLSAHGNLAQFTEQTILKFTPDNPEKFLPSDPVIFKLKAKNAKRILVRVFEVKTFEYLQQHDGAVMGQNLNLDGLTPNWEHNIALDHPPLEMHDIKIELPELVNRRGAFVMDVISNGENSCAYFTKGYLDFIERQSVAGHVLTVLDENQEKLSEKCSVWFNGYYYKPNGDGDVIIPYRKPSSSSSEHVYLIHDGFTSRQKFDHQVEDYSYQFACHIDHESLVAGAKAKILVKPTVGIRGNTVICPVSLMEQVQLTIESCDTNNVISTTTVPDFKVYDVDWSEYNFQVPENLSSMSVTLSAKIKVISTGEFQDLTTDRRFKFDSPLSDTSVSFEQNGILQTVRVPGGIVTLLQKYADGYKVLALGKNGEKRPNIPLGFRVVHRLWKESINFYLRSDENGHVHLGHLVDIDQLTCTNTRMNWQISGREEHAYPDQINAVQGEAIYLPLGQKDLFTIRTISLFSISGLSNEKCYLDDHTNNIRLNNGLLSIKGLKAGYYYFRIGDMAGFPLAIAHSSAACPKIQGLENFLIGSNPMLELMDSTKQPLYMSELEADSRNQMVDIQLYNWSAETRLCIIASKFVPYVGTAFDELHVLSKEDPWVKMKTDLTPTSFKTGRVLGEEYQYILNRKAQTNHWAGNLLTKPSVLLSPWSIAETTMSKQIMLKDCVTDVQIRSSHSNVLNSSAQLGGSRSTGLAKKSDSSRACPLLNFLVHPSVVLVNLIPDVSTGQISIPYSAFKEGTFLEIFAMDGRQALQQSFVVPRSSGDLDFQKRDLRFKSQLDHTKHYIRERAGVDMDPKLQAATDDGAASVTLASNGSSSSAVRVINSVSQVYDLMLTLLVAEDQKEILRKFGFITDWHRLSKDAKKEKFSKWNCHELNLFLFKKDLNFFEAVVVPFLKNKLMKSFMDDYLIGASMEKYVALNEFNRLTCMEKCLLTHRVPSVKTAVAQWIKDRMQNKRAASNVKLFLTVMNSGALKESAPGASSPKYSPTSPTYSPTSPIFRRGSPTYQPRSYDEEEEESDEDMGFGLFSGSEAEGAPASTSYSAPPPRPMARMFSADFDNDDEDYADFPRKMKTKMTARKTTGGLDRDRERSEQILQNQFKPVDLTKEMAETYYYGREDFKSVDNSVANVFWLDLASWDGSKGGSFLSQNFVANAGSFTDAMATIALLDVTFRPRDVSATRSADHNLVVSSQSPAIVFHSSIKELTEPPVTGSVLVTEQYFEQTEKTMYDEVMMTNVRKYIQPGAEFRPLESYGAHVVLMNATPNHTKVHLEVQIPQGSISVYGSLESGQDIQLNPHGTFQYEYGFYFPEAGDFPHYPAHVSNYEDIIAHAAPSVLKVRAPKPDRKETDTDTWSHILKRGNKEDILKKLTSSPLSSLPVELLLPRLYKDRRFLRQVTLVLRSRQEFHERIWSVGLALQNQELVKEYLMSQSASFMSVGDWFTSNVYVSRPHSRLDGSSDWSFKYLEYFPLINARAHKATRNSTILNNRFKDQYTQFLKLLSQKPHHDVDDLLVLIVYLLAQDRIMEAKDKFAQLSALMDAPGQPSREFFQKLQYDYLWAYLSLCVEVQVDTPANNLTLDLAGIQKVLETYCSYPVERWNKMFKDMQQYVDEIVQTLTEIKSSVPEGQSTAVEGSPDAQLDASAAAVTSTAVDEERDDDGSAPEVPVMVDFNIGSDSVLTVHHRGVRGITVEYYSIDAETMFSASPLTLGEQGESETISGNGESDSSNSYRLVKPNGIDTHSVKRAIVNDGICMIPILPQYLNNNVMISVSTSPPAATRTWKAYYSQTILVQCLEKTGTIRVISKNTAGISSSSNGGPIRGAYVKVYAELKQGSGVTTFWKDGYTDLVGRFAYALVSSGGGAGDGGLGAVKRFAVFVDGGREGCVVKTLPVPPV
ncbi:hypothetical protein EDD21DRAFT_384542 [Dissophora ornata]|nr:hypothetical protein EDD21DRAFT_384542 [Dissophora ornata]